MTGTAVATSEGETLSADVADGLDARGGAQAAKNRMKLASTRAVQLTYVFDSRALCSDGERNGAQQVRKRW